jgi:protein kinase
MKDKFGEWSDTASHLEFQAICALSQQCSSYIVQIYEVIREADSNLYFVCEYMPDGTLNDLLTQTRERGGGGGGDNRVSTPIIQSILQQVLQGMEHIHSWGYMHRDLKPENLLLSGAVVKVADFSLARTTTPNNTNGKTKMTSYVSTRWYRAPELILCAPRYSTAIDIFALGCIMAELYRMYPLFPGTGELDQLKRILDLMGPLRDAEWPEGVSLSKRFGLEPSYSSSSTPPHHHQSPKIKMTSTRNRLEKEIPTADSMAISFLLSLLDLNPSRRPSARDALAHDYFGTNVSLSQTTTGGRQQQTTYYDEPTAEEFTTTPLKTSTGESIDNNSCAPFMSISPSMRNVVSDRTGPYWNSVPRFDAMDSDSRIGSDSNLQTSLLLEDNIGHDGFIPPTSQESSSLARKPKIRRTGYRPSQAFNMDY